MLRTLLLERHLTHLQAALYATFAYFMFSSSDAMGKWLMSEGYERSTILVLNSFPSLFILVGFMVYRHGFKTALHTHYKGLHILRGLTLIGITYFMFNAIGRLPLTDFYGVVFSTPFFVTLGAFLLFKEKTTLTEWICILIGFAGVLVVVQPQGLNLNVGYLYGIGAVLCVAAASLIVRKIGRDENPYLFVIFGNIAILLANIIPALSAPIPQVTLAHIIVFSIYAFTIPTAILTLSAVFARAPSVASVTPFQYLQIVWGTLFGYLVFHDIPKINTLIGSGIVIACGLYIVFHHQQKRRQSTH